MDKIKVLANGYAKKINTGWKASSTITLIRSNDRNISDIDLVFLTHYYHPDHAFLASIFKKAIMCDGDTLYIGDRVNEFSKFLPKTSVEAISTPGHANEHASLIIKTKKRTVVVAGDLFWWTSEEKQETKFVSQLINKVDPYTKDKKDCRRVEKLF